MFKHLFRLKREVEEVKDENEQSIKNLDKDKRIRENINVRLDALAMELDVAARKKGRPSTGRR